MQPTRLTLLLTLLVGLFPPPASARPPEVAASVYGTVRAAQSREPVARATVEIPELRRVAVTDDAGYFVLPDVRAGRWTVRASAPGFAPVELILQVPPDGSVPLDFDLPARAVAIQGIEARGEVRGRVASGVGPGAVRIDAMDVDAVPALAEADVLRTIQLLPSVQAASDFSSAPYVRGGSPDQNLVLLDGVPLFNPYHLGGVFGAIDPDAVASVDVLPGAFPARVGDRLSSAIEIRTRDGGRDRIRGNGGVGLISSRASVDGPLPGGEGSFLFSARRTYLDLFTDAAFGLGLINGTLPYAFTDAHLKLTHDVGELGSVTASVYVDEEGFSIPEEVDFSGDADFAWGSRMASLGFRQAFSPSLVGEFRAAITAFGGRFRALDAVYDDRGELLPDSLDSILDAHTRAQDILAAADLVWYGRDHELRGGVQWDRYLLDHELDVVQDDFGDFVPEFARRDEPRTVAAYLEDEWTPGEALGIRAGLRVLHARARGTAWMPRVAAEYAIRPDLTLSAGAGRYAQVLHTLRDEESFAASLMAYDFLGAVTPDAGLATGSDVVLGAAWASGNTRVRLDGYAKWLRGLSLPPVPDDVLESPVLVSQGFRSGEARSRGVELLAQHTRGAAEFSLAYALSSVELEAGGERYPPRYDRRHTLDALAALPLGPRGQVSARLALASGQAYTPVLGLIQGYRFDPASGGFEFGYGEASFVLGEHNSARLPGYFRLDVGARKSFERRWWGRTVTLTPYLQILNVLNSPNVLAAVPQGANYGQPELEYLPQLPIFPTLGVEWTF